MPKKTRREKILAELHRKTYEPLIASSAPQYAYQAVPTQPQSVTLEYVTEYRAIKIDLLKTLVLASIAIGVEVMLYFKIGR